MLAAETATLYLSRLWLDWRARAVRRDLADCQALHRTIMVAFPQAPPGETEPRKRYGLLYRVEVADEDGGLPILVQSLVAPDWSRLPEGYLRPTWDAAEGFEVKPLDGFYGGLRGGMALRFRLRANPTRRVARPDDPLRGKRVELQREEEQLAWLARKGEQGGFRLLHVRAAASVADVRASHGVNVVGYRSEAPKGQRQMTFGSVLFEGRLAIEDAEQFRQTLATGIGSGKAYGFGLLSVAPA